MSEFKIPVVSLSQPTQKNEFHDNVNVFISSLHKYGCIYIKLDGKHSNQIIQDAFQQMKLFFDLPEHRKVWLNCIDST